MQILPADGPEKSSFLPAHGGNLDWAAVIYGTPKAGWLDLSTGINPNAYPLPEISPQSWQRLPGKTATRKLLDTARRYYGFSEDASLCPLPGTQAAIQRLPHLIAPCEVAILSPTYSEHGICWARAGHRVREISTLSELKNARVVVLVHPNNPDGRLYAKLELHALQEEMRRRGGLLVVDEAFADTAPDVSLAPLAGGDGLVILKSLGKFFGLAGLRLGFMAGPLILVEQMREEIGPWAVSGPALEIGTKALTDSIWIDEMRKSLALSAKRVDRMLENTGLELRGGTDLFRLVETPDAPRLFDHLCRAGLLVRAFEGRPRHLRFGLPGEEKDWRRLKVALHAFAK
ncbi:MAG: threonine-phosphate decarboxylase [Alphaproteobacteria bacterium]|nr:MAG: threonine-phosphate decarboxylase [Alphaproteobacteria bacterium]